MPQHFAAPYSHWVRLPLCVCCCTVLHSSKASPTSYPPSPFSGLMTSLPLVVHATAAYETSAYSSSSTLIKIYKRKMREHADSSAAPLFGYAPCLSRKRQQFRRCARISWWQNATAACYYIYRSKLLTCFTTYAVATHNLYWETRSPALCSCFRRRSLYVYVHSIPPRHPFLHSALGYCINLYCGICCHGDHR